MGKTSGDTEKAVKSPAARMVYRVFIVTTLVIFLPVIGMLVYAGDERSREVHVFIDVWLGVWVLAVPIGGALVFAASLVVAHRKQRR